MKNVAPTTLDAWQATLAGEQAALYVWGVLGARTSASASPDLYAALRSAYAEHRSRRDTLIATVAATGVEPAPAATAYTLPTGLATPEGLAAAAAELEDRCSALYASLVGSTVGPARLQAIDWLTTSAVRVLAFRENPEMFPGAGEFADH